jgi:hypothetical protein
MMLAQFGQFAAFFGMGAATMTRRQPHRVPAGDHRRSDCRDAGAVGDFSRPRIRSRRDGGAPDGFARRLNFGLAKLEAGAHAIPTHSMSPQTAHLCIVNPLSGQSLAGLFSTHPPMEQRIANLQRVGQTMGQFAF